MNNINYYINNVLLENTPLKNFTRNHIRDAGGISSISSLVKISMTSLISCLALKLYLNLLGVWSKHLQISSRVLDTQRDFPYLCAPTYYPLFIKNYIITQVILPFWLVLAYDLLEDRRTIEVIITKFFPLCFKMAESFENLNKILLDWAKDKVQKILVQALNRYEKQEEER